MHDRVAYDASQIDWENLKKYANLVARTTKLPPNPSLSYLAPDSGDVLVEKKKRILFGLIRRTMMVSEHRAGWKRIEVLGAHWRLDHHQQFWQDDVRHQEGTVENTLALLPDGRLVKVIVSKRYYGPCETCWSNKHERREVNDWDVQVLDFKDRSVISSSLLYRSKGTGVQVALAALEHCRSPA